MKRNSIGSVWRTLTALIMVALLMSVGFAGVSPDTVTVANAEELSTALSNAATSGNTTIIYFAPGTSQIEVSGALSGPSNVTIDLSSSGGTLLISSGGALSVGGVITGGTAYPNGFIGRPAAGKTGTTDNHADAWFCGYTPQLATAVWMG